MKVLFLGGTGVISSACSQRCLMRGIDLYLLNRGQTTRPIPEGATVLTADLRQPETVRTVLQDRTFDVVVDWIAFTPEHIDADLNLFRGRTGQYVFISSASVYQTPPVSLPVTESTPIDNPYWEYSRQKIACEDRLMRAYREEKFPVTIVRPSHTYDKTMLPLQGRYTVIDRMRKGRPVIVHGDGTSLWTLTHHQDFAKGFVGLLGNVQAIGQAFHITSQEVLTWNQIFEILAAAAGTTADLVHVPSEVIARFDRQWGAGLLGDKAHSMIFENAKIKRLVPDFTAIIPFSRGAQDIMAWFDADPARQVVDDAFNRTVDTIINACAQLHP